MTKGKSPSKKHEDGKEPKESGLATPTSITMQTSYIIKNADDSFDAYHQQMKKRKMKKQDSLELMMIGMFYMRVTLI